MSKKNNKFSRIRFNVVVISIIAALVLGGAGFVGYQVKSSLDKEIYGTPRGEIGKRNPSGLGLDYEKIKFTSSNTTEDNLTIYGWFINGKTDHCIILAPGKGQSRWKLFDYIPFLHDAGYDVLMFDPQGRGKSEGKKWGFGYFESRDIINGIQYLGENYGIEDVGILGRSAGATAALIAAIDNKKVKAVVADCPFASIKLASESYGNYENNPLFDLLFPLYGFGANQMLDTDIIEKTDLTERISDLENPVFFIHGEDDQVLYTKNSKLLYKHKPGKKKLWTPGDIGHVEGFEERPKVYKEKILSFFEKQL